VLLRGSEHGSYTDAQVLLPQIAKQVKDLPPDLIAGDIGYIDPSTAITCEQAYVSGFFDLFLRHLGIGPASPGCSAAVVIP
jgi:hypothetical protein